MAGEAPTMMQAKQAFSCSLDGVGRVPYAVGAGDIFKATDEVVVRYPEMFRALRVRDSDEVRRPLPAHPGATETATAAPGERRSMARQPARPPKSAAGTPAAPTPAVPATTSSEV